MTDPFQIDEFDEDGLPVSSSGTVDPIDLVWWFVQWLEEHEGSGSIRTFSDEWKDPNDFDDDGDFEAPSAQEPAQTGWTMPTTTASSSDPIFTSNVWGLGRDEFEETMEDEGVMEFVEAFAVWEDAAV